jgi:hypothetical protein
VFLCIKLVDPGKEFYKLRVYIALIGFHLLRMKCTFTSGCFNLFLIIFANPQFRSLKVAHLILAYKNPEQVYRLAKSLYSPNTHIFIHIDKKVDQRQFQYIAALPNVNFIRDRYYIVWGGYSITECYISGIKEILAHDKYDYVVLMSGQDYPLKAKCRVP